MRTFLAALYSSVMSLLLCSPTFAAPIGPDDLFRGCANQFNLRSVVGNQSILLHFINTTRGTIVIFWINYQGAKQFYNRLGPNESYTQQTFVTHPWVITDSGLRCLAAFTATQTQDVVIKERPNNAGAANWSDTFTRGDWIGRDRACSQGPFPDASQCNSAFFWSGQAVCWSNRHTGECGGAIAWCTYKTVGLTTPHGYGTVSDGEIYKCGQ